MGVALVTGCTWQASNRPAWHVDARDLDLRPGNLPTEQLQNAIDHFGRIFFPAGLYVTGNIRLRSGTSLAGEKGTVFLQHPEFYYLFSINPGVEGSADCAANVRNVSLRKLTCRGQSALLGFAEHRHLLNFNGCSQVLVTDCRFESFRGDGIYLGSGNQPGIERHNEDITIRRCIFDGVNGENRNAISIIDGTRIRITNCHFDRCSRPDMPGAIDIEPDDNPFHVIRDIQISRNSISRCSGGSGAISLILPSCELVTPPSDVRLHHNRIEGGGRCNGITAIQYCLAQSPDSRPTISMLRNHVFDTDRPFVVSGVAGADLFENHFENSRQAAAFSLPYQAPAMRVRAVRNSLLQLGQIEGTGLRLHRTRGVQLAENHFAPPRGRHEWTAVYIEDQSGNFFDISANRFEGRPFQDTAALIVRGMDTKQLANVLSNNFFADDVQPLR